MEKSFCLANCDSLFKRILSSVIFDTSDDANPSNRPLSVLFVDVTFANVSIMSTVFGPPITSIGISGIVYLMFFTSRHPGSEMQGIPASLTIATCLVSKRAFTISNILV